MGKGSAPQAPDPYQSAAAQYQYGTQAAEFNQGLNNVNTQGPLSSTNYQITGYGAGGAPQTTQTTTLSPAEQQILQASQGEQIGAGAGAPAAASQAASAINAGLPSNMPGIQYNPTGYTGPQTSVNQGAFQTALQGQEAALNPVWSQQHEQLDASLRNSGATPGSPAYDNAMAAFNAQETGAYSQAAGQAENTATGVLTAENAGAGQQYQEALQNLQANNQARGTALEQGAQQGEIPLQELQMMEGLQQPYTGGAPSPSQGYANAPDIQSAMQQAYQGQLNSYNAQQGTQSQLYGDAGTMAALAMMFMSDERLKKNLELTNFTPAGIPIYRYQYKYEPGQYEGVMAQDVEQVAPQAVHEHESGFKMVDYSQVP